MKVEKPKPIVIKLTYDVETGIVDGFTFEETDKPWVEITREQFNLGFHYKRLRVVNGKIEEITKDLTIKVAIVPGNRWFTDESNMLIIGKDRGWDERRDS